MNSTPPSCPLRSWTCPAAALPQPPSTVPQTRRTSLPASQVMHAGEVPAITRAALLAPLSSPSDRTLGPELASASPAAPGHRQKWPPLALAPLGFSLRHSFISQSC